MDQPKVVYTPFTVLSVSTNTNSFGLYGMILIAENGIAYEVAANSLNVKKVGQKVNVPHHEGKENFTFAHLNFEIPHRFERNTPPKHAKKLIAEACS